MGEKVCTVCKESKDLSEYFNYKTSRDGKFYRCKSCDKKTRKKTRFRSEKNPTQDGYRRRLLQIYYNMTVEDYNNLLERQGGGCGICGTRKPCGEQSSSERLKHFAVDHCHKTGRIRGLLCNACNRALGLFQDDIEILEAASKYLKECH